MYLLGLDIGSSSIKAAIVRSADHAVVASAQQPSEEMEIIAVQPGWAEQKPEVWWQYTQLAIKSVIEQSGINGQDITSVGISYQMHGLVLVDKDQNVLRPAIIWCDSRAVSIGDQAFQDIGPTYSLENYLNSPGNFTASKLKWVKENEPDIYDRIHKVLLPGDYIAMKLTGELSTTVSGLSEGILWNFKEHTTANKLLDYYGIAPSLIAEPMPSVSLQGRLRAEVATSLGLSPKTVVSYRAGDQPNNAMSLGVLEPGQIAATGGTSGVVYGVTDQYIYDKKSRVNTFAHVNHSAKLPRLGVLLCINGAGIQYAWMRKNIAGSKTAYNDMETLAGEVPIGSDGLRILPFGNGAERMLENKDQGATIRNLRFSNHTSAHMYRAALEGIACSFAYGCEVLSDLGMQLTGMRVGNDNLFRSQIFSQTVANLLDTNIELVQTSGAVGAAKASGVATGTYSNLAEATTGTEIEKQYLPTQKGNIHKEMYQRWRADLDIFNT